MIPNDSIDFYPTPDDLADDMIRPTGQQRRQRAFIPARAHPGAFRRERRHCPGRRAGLRYLPRAQNREDHLRTP